jgi:hypothetical protein
MSYLEDNLRVAHERSSLPTAEIQEFVSMAEANWRISVDHVLPSMKKQLKGQKTLPPWSFEFLY